MKSRKECKVCLLVLIVFLSTLNYGCRKEKDDAIALINFNPNNIYGSLTDQDGNTYKTVIIGTQTWMAENLKTTKYRNGDPIPNDIYPGDWENLTTGAYCNYDNDAKYVNVYGHFYNWYAVNDSRNLAPMDWHVATDGDWTILINYLGGGSTASNKLCETGTTHWSYNVATNESGFTALPGGYLSNQTIFYQPMGYHFSFLGVYGWYWSASDTITYAWSRLSEPQMSRHYVSKHWGFSVRCVKD